MSLLCVLAWGIAKAESFDVIWFEKKAITISRHVCI